ncbi:VCBS repeat protein [Geothermobacter ehrlichii]|uniref:VCBS repeat protein n=1 Tax=Geothermobacter ehrlichii TaxID=213224 RepID=A0A5D3WIV6_9BACT|nr:VCBS repeat-containing protein [Geothermobacter ehrlichii]TYO97129.1 VCBS repeat protein [Geothermobacter ehrlichii]
MGKKTLCVLLAALMLCLGSGLVLAQEFVDISSQAGVADAGLGKGVAFGDINNDGLVDLYVSNKGGANHLYLNKGNGKFEDITARAGEGLDYPGLAMGSVFGDYNNDGFVDLYLATGGRYEIEANRLFRNNGDGTFTDVTEEAGVGLKAFTYGASWADYDNDGYLDLYCANYGVGAKNVLFHNNGDGTFTDVTDVAGVGDRSWSWMGVWADVNGDHYVDLYVVNGQYPVGEKNRLYINNGDGTFRDATSEAGVEDPNWGLGAAFADIDNDGDLDLFVSNYVGPNNLYLNDGKGVFTLANEKIAGTHEGWGKGPTFGDVDHDGDLDLYEGDCKLANQLYLNDGKGNFVNVADRQPQLKCETVRTKGTAFADIDNDGDLDLYVINWGAENKLYLNNQNDNNWLKVKVTGSISSRDAYGTRVEVFESGKTELKAMREIRSATGFCAQSPKVAHFGLDASRRYDVVATFPSGLQARMDNVKTGQTIELIEPATVEQRQLAKAE